MAHVPPACVAYNDVKNRGGDKYLDDNDDGGYAWEGQYYYNCRGRPHAGRRLGGECSAQGDAF